MADGEPLLAEEIRFLRLVCSPSPDLLSSSTHLSLRLTCLPVLRQPDASRCLFPTWGHVSVLMRIVPEPRTGRGLQSACAGKGALLPSVGGAGSLQPRAGRLKPLIIIVRNKYRLPAKSWSAASLLPNMLAARILKYFSSLNIMFIETVAATGNVFVG